MRHDILCSGFGGQGALTIGKFIAKAAMAEGKFVSWLPSYGPEMRGGTANVSVVVSDAEIASPIVSFPNVLVALNQPSLDKFGPDVKAGGLMIANTDMCPNKLGRKDITEYYAPMNTIAKEIGNEKVLNMIAIGMIIGHTKMVSYETLEKDLSAFLLKKNPQLLEMNLKAIKHGMDLVK